MVRNILFHGLLRLLRERDACKYVCRPKTRQGEKKDHLRARDLTTSLPTRDLVTRLGETQLIY